MAGTTPTGVPAPQREGHDPDGELTLSLAREDLALSRRVRRTLVRAARTTAVREEVVSADLAREQVVIERVPVGRVVESTPPVREEGDVTIVPVVVEELVVVRRLVLREEVHLRRVRTVARHSETVPLREQQVTVTRTPLDD